MINRLDLGRKLEPLNIYLFLKHYQRNIIHPMYLKPNNYMHVMLISGKLMIVYGERAYCLNY